MISSHRALTPQRIDQACDRVGLVEGWDDDGCELGEISHAANPESYRTCCPAPRDPSFAPLSGSLNEAFHAIFGFSPKCANYGRTPEV